VLAGPDRCRNRRPEATEVLDELRAAYAGLHPRIQDDIALVELPMRSVEETRSWSTRCSDVDHRGAEIAA